MLTLLVEMERVRVFFLEVTMCVDPVSENVKEDECWKMRVFIDNPCHAIGSKNAGQN